MIETTLNQQRSSREAHHMYQLNNQRAKLHWTQSTNISTLANYQADSRNERSHCNDFGCQNFAGHRRLEIRPTKRYTTLAEFNCTPERQTLELLTRYHASMYIETKMQACAAACPYYLWKMGLWDDCVVVFRGLWYFRTALLTYSVPYDIVLNITWHYTRLTLSPLPWRRHGTVWEITSLSSLTSFRRQLKTELFARSFPDSDSSAAVCIW